MKFEVLKSLGFGIFCVVSIALASAALFFLLMYTYKMFMHFGFTEEAAIISVALCVSSLVVAVIHYEANKEKL
jgi:hypothetical protein